VTATQSTTDAASLALAPRRDDPKKIASSASDFEALLLTQMMKSAREATSMTHLDGEDTGSYDAVMEYAEQQFGSILAKSGGFGIAKLVASGLSPKESTSPTVGK